MILFLHALQSGWSVLLCEWDLLHILFAVLFSVIKHMSGCNSLWHLGQQGRTCWYYKEGEDAGLCEVYQERCGIFQVRPLGTSFCICFQYKHMFSCLCYSYIFTVIQVNLCCVFLILFPACFAGKINLPMHSWFPKSQVSVEFVKLSGNCCCWSFMKCLKISFMQFSFSF